MNSDRDSPDERTATSPDVDGGAPASPGLTIVFTIVAGIAYLAAQALVLFAVLSSAMRRDPALDVESWIGEHQWNGTLLSVGAIAGTAASVPLTLAFGRIAGGGSMRDSLGLRSVGVRDTLGWTLAIIVFALAADWLTWQRGDEIVPGFMVDAYHSARPQALLWFALVVAAPVSEELLFRGLLFTGLLRSGWGFPGAAVASAACWAALHIQYDAIGMTTIALAGLLLAAARFNTNSIYPCLTMHAAMNAIATCEVAYIS